MGKVLHASGSGYFPFCLTEGTPPETGRGTSYPISLPLEQYMSWWWKVKTWTLTGSSACNERATPPDAEELVNDWTTTGLNQDDSWTSSIPSEENLPCQSTRVISPIGFDGVSVGDLAGPFTNNWSVFFEANAYIDGSTVYPEMNVAGWYDSLSAGDPKVQAQLDPVSTFRIDGVLIPTYINWFPTWTEYDDWSITGSQSFDLEPETYWPYS
jgi:hypothetical protein